MSFRKIRGERGHLEPAGQARSEALRLVEGSTLHATRPPSPLSAPPYLHFAGAAKATHPSWKRWPRNGSTPPPRSSAPSHGKHDHEQLIEDSGADRGATNGPRRPPRGGRPSAPRTERGRRGPLPSGHGSRRRCTTPMTTVATNAPSASRSRAAAVRSISYSSSANDNLTDRLRDGVRCVRRLICACLSPTANCTSGSRSILICGAGPRPVQLR